MRHSGLTLIELIIVVGITAVLIAVLLPMASRVKLQARATICTSNIRQISLALYEYTTDSGRFPYGFNNQPNQKPPGGYAGRNQYDRMGWWWFNYMKGFYEKSRKKQFAINCPSRQLQNIELENDILCGNYGVNLSICRMPVGKQNQAEFVGEPLANIEVMHPSQTLLLLDSGYAIINWWYATDIPPVTFGNSLEETAYVPGLSINRKRHLWPGQEMDAYYGRHPQMTVNVGFVDCHVMRTKAEDLLVKKADDDCYKNRYPLWTPDSR